MLVDLNTTPVEHLGFINPIVLEDLNINSCKNASISQALEYYRDTPVVDIIQQLYSCIEKPYKHILVDVKVQDLVEGTLPCLPGWHVDGGPEVDSEYVLMAAGSSLTEFCETPFRYHFNGNVKQFCKEINLFIGEGYTSKVNNWQVIKYNNLAPHRGAIAHTTGRRLLIRVMGSDKIPPQPIRK